MITFLIVLALVATAIVIGWAAIWAFLFGLALTITIGLRVWLVTVVIGFLIDLITSYKGNAGFF